MRIKKIFIFSEILFYFCEINRFLFAKNQISFKVTKMLELQKTTSPTTEPTVAPTAAPSVAPMRTAVGAFFCVLSTKELTTFERRELSSIWRRIVRNFATNSVSLSSPSLLSSLLSSNRRLFGISSLKKVFISSIFSKISEFFDFFSKFFSLKTNFENIFFN